MGILVEPVGVWYELSELAALTVLTVLAELAGLAGVSEGNGVRQCDPLDPKQKVRSERHWRNEAPTSFVLY